MDKKNSLGKVLRRLRVEGEYTQAEFAKLFEISRPFLSKLENGEKNPSVELLERISEKLKIPLAVIYLKAMDEESIPRKNREEIIEAIQPAIDRIQSYFPISRDLMYSEDGLVEKS